jgi:FeS assembly protein IscX
VVVGEDGWVAEDVHQESVGAVGTVQLHPLPVGAGADTAMCGVSLGKATMPVGVGGDGGIACGMEVAVSGLFGLLIVAKDDAGLLAGGVLMKEAAGGGEMLSASVEVAAEERGRPGCLSALRLVHHKTVASFLYSLEWWLLLPEISLSGDVMAFEFDWTDSEEIGIQLQEKYPEIEPYTVRFTDLHKYVTELPGFVGDPAKSNEGILEAIQAAWNEEYEDAK